MSYESSSILPPPLEERRSFESQPSAKDDAYREAATFSDTPLRSLHDYHFVAE
jgi:hypothetical protein